MQKYWKEIHVFLRDNALIFSLFLSSGMIGNSLFFSLSSSSSHWLTIFITECNTTATSSHHLAAEMATTV